MIDIHKLNFEKSQGLIPCIVQDANTHRVLMLGYMNREALNKTLAENRLTFFSRTKQRLWTKGETSGNYLTLVDVTMDCDQDTLLFKVNPTGPTCHTGSDTCFNEKNEGAGLDFLERIINDRKNNPKSGSYTNQLLNSGINKVAQKVGEEAVELVIEAKDDNKELFLNEAADLMYHFLVLLTAKGVKLEEIVNVLKSRHAK
ncbi:MAG TPA: bifunctional phosphoribosyl-AMP cyclohydrolase/phosphoribosyl-ATP diphosphatase HisIE [Cyclobacteriaceae bacterium]|nr:bifunctional phosphoribosyl-AMP cyclohydrolase/phosphoribosyl-ATP diphosphatase HisIE [Cyclobacteriaceae bacterium]HPW62965.1 bifunctional phosphoribosyl-AMP cyclohydrolase/phosphoribosyl-ATP diphosphatase HisIE [Cyclobacteriaceae bacterium]